MDLCLGNCIQSTLGWTDCSLMIAGKSPKKKRWFLILTPDKRSIPGTSWWSTATSSIKSRHAIEVTVRTNRTSTSKVNNLSTFPPAVPTSTSSCQPRTLDSLRRIRWASHCHYQLGSLFLVLCLLLPIPDTAELASRAENEIWALKKKNSCERLNWSLTWWLDGEISGNEP